MHSPPLVRRWQRVVLLFILPIFLLSAVSCGTVVQYPLSLTNPETGRTPLVTWPAVFGLGVGFVGGLPLSVAGMPVSYPTYKIVGSPEPGYFPSTYFMLPPLVISQFGAVAFGSPFDLLEFVTYRWWSGGEGGGPDDEEHPLEEDL